MTGATETLSDAYIASRKATDDFFDRYSNGAGNVDYLYSKLSKSDDALAAGATSLPSDTDPGFDALSAPALGLGTL